MESTPEEYPFTFVTNIKEPKANSSVLQKIYNYPCTVTRFHCLSTSIKHHIHSFLLPPVPQVSHLPPSPGRTTLNLLLPTHQQKPQKFSLHLPLIVHCR